MTSAPCPAKVIAARDAVTMFESSIILTPESGKIGVIMGPFGIFSCLA